jgi:hypothetical protein
MTSRGWLLSSTVGVAGVAAALGGEHVRAQRGFGVGPPDREKRLVVKQFDADGNGRLNDAERAEARTWLATQPQRGVGVGRRGFGGGDGGVTLDPLIGLDGSTKPLRLKLLAVPALRARYLAYVREIAENWLDWRTLGPLASTYRTLIALTSTTTRSSSTHQTRSKLRAEAATRA